MNSTTSPASNSADRSLTRNGKVTVALCLVGVLCLATLAMFTVRNWAIKTYGTSQAQEDWLHWIQSAEAMNEPGSSVQRRVPDVNEKPDSAIPPAVRLMRDHFFTCLVGVWVLTVLVGGTFIYFVIGVFSQPAIQIPTPEEENRAFH